ncbi:MAG: flippase-like domain-containing protein [Chlamydiota bacterium]|nr:flippase-like domain-containing protein [Chlamydiota bacterium]
MNKTKIIFLFLGLGAIAYLFYHVGLSSIADYLYRLGWKSWLIFIPFFIINYIDTWAWYFTFTPMFPSHCISFSNIFWLRICGEAVNNFTPTAHIGGDVTRVICLKRMGIAKSVGLVSVMMDKAALIISEIIFVYTGLFLLLTHMESSFRMKLWIGLSFPIILFLLYVLILAVRMGLLSQLSDRLKVRFNRDWFNQLHHKIQKLDQHLHQFLHHQRRAFLWSTLLHYIGWLVGTFETWIMLYCIGIHVNLLDAMMIEALIILVKGLGFFMIGSLGIQEGGAVIFFKILALGQGAGLAFSLLKRARELFFGLLGWIVLWRQFPKLREDMGSS